MQKDSVYKTRSITASFRVVLATSSGLGKRDILFCIIMITRRGFVFSQIKGRGLQKFFGSKPPDPYFYIVVLEYHLKLGAP